MILVFGNIFLLYVIKHLIEVFLIYSKLKFFSIFLIIVFLVNIPIVCADDLGNETLPSDIDDFQFVGEISYYADGSPNNNIGQSTSDDDLADLSECSSVVLHVSDNEGVISFRRDSTDSTDLSVVTGSWGDIDFVKQYKTAGGYFFHAIVTSNGWIIGDGGITDGQYNRQIEEIASQMVLNNEISDSYLSRVYNILSRYSLGHFVIKAPDGTYGVAFSNLYHAGKLSPGQYVVCPNVYSKSQKGTYSTSLSPVDASIRLAYTDSYGVNRRNVMTYNWKISTSSTGLSFGVDCYASNDNGAGVGRSTAYLADNVNFLGKYYSKSSLPLTPNKLYLGTHVFDKSSIEIFKLLNPIDAVLIGESINVNYQVNYVANSNPVVRFTIPEGFKFNNAILSKGDYTYDEGSHVVTWYLNNCNQNNFITLSLNAVKSGKYSMKSSLNNFVYEFDLSVNNYGAFITSNNITKYYKGSEKFNVYLKDCENNPIIGQSIVFNINGINYDRATNENGLASLAINLNPDNYSASASYNGRFGSNSTQISIQVLTTISGNDIVKQYRNDTQYYARFLDTSGNPLINQMVKFNINGVFYTRQTNDVGVARLNINLDPGEYILTAINQNDESHSNMITVLPNIINNTDLVKYYKNDSQYYVTVLDDEGNPVGANKTVLFNINGVYYNRNTNENGVAGLNINLSPGNYIITAIYNEFMVSNNIEVLPILFADDLNMSYGDGSKFKAKLLDGQGNPFADQNITFNINGVFYNKTTNFDGIAELNINLQAGEYIISSYYNGCGIGNKITISG